MIFNLPGDYALLAKLRALKECQDARDDLGFAIGLKEIWKQIDQKIPDDLKNDTDYLALHMYFMNKGDIGKSINLLLSAMHEVGLPPDHEKHMQNVDKTLLFLRMLGLAAPNRPL